MSQQSGYDTRKYECCAPYHGEIGDEFTRRFQPEFEGALHTYVDNYASLYEHVVLQTDPGSAADPAPAGAPGNAIRVAFATRQKKSFGLIRRHIEDSTIRDEIDANAMGNGPAAWQIVIAYGQVPQTFLNLAEQEKEWNSTRLIEVGYTERTIENFRGLLQRINRERPAAQQKSNVHIWQKLLEEVGNAGNSELKTLVRNELQRQTMVHPAGHPLAGQPDIAANVMYFSERWRSLISDGSIKYLPPRKRTAPTGNRVDAMLTTTTNLEAEEKISTESSKQLVLLGQAQMGTESERYCYNCKGFGHTKADQTGKVICPSPVKSRPLAQCIASLEAALRRERQRPGRKRFIARRQTSRASGKLADAEDVEIVDIDEEDNVFDSDGNYLGTLQTPEEHDDLNGSNISQPASMKQNGSQTVKAGLAAAADSDKCVHAQAPTPSQPTTLIEEIDENFEQAFMSSTVPLRYAAADGIDTINNSHEDETNPPWLQANAKPARRATLVGAGLLIGLAAMATPGRQAGRLLMTLSMACCVASVATAPRMIHVKPKIMIASPKPETTENTLNPRTGMALDTGASMHASGRAELFPENLIVARNPNILVEIANNEQCAVKHLGTMKIPIRYRDHIGTSKQRTGHLLLPNAIYVPKLGDNTLLAPKALFHDSQARTYVNDDLFVRLQDGKILDFTETKTLYILPFANAKPTESKILVSKVVPSADALHSRCMHFSLDRIRKSAQCLEHAHVDDVMQSGIPQSTCSTCTRAAARKHNAHRRKGTTFTHFGECVASDTCDMEEYSTPFGFRYFLSFMDLATKYLLVYFLRTHTHAEVRAAYLQFIADVHRFLPDGHVKLWFMDNGSEFNVAAGVGKDKPGFFANNADTWLAEYFTRRRFIVPWNPQMNPAESVNRMLLRPTRAALAAAPGITTRFWPFAVHQASIVHNALITDSETAVHAMEAAVCTMAALAKMLNVTDNTPAQPRSPYMMVHKRKFNMDMLHTLFCICHCTLRNPSDIASLPKAAPRTTRAMHLGLDHRRAGFFVYLFDFQRFTTSAFKDTYFEREDDFDYKGQLPHGLTGEVRQPTEARLMPNPTEQALNRHIPEAADISQPNAPEDRAGRILADLPSSRTRSRTAEQHAMLVPTSTGIPPEFQCVCSTDATMLLVKTDVWRPISCPTSTAEALAQDHDGWMAAYRKDFEAKAANGSFEFRDREPWMTVHKLGWAHKLIWNDDNTLLEKRARMVGKGYTQVQGRDYDSSYAATPRASAVRIFQAAICQQDLEEEHCDVTKAFTQNDMEGADLYVELPAPLQAKKGSNGLPQIIKLLKALEGFKQSGHIHQKNHTATFTTPNQVATFNSLECEPTLLIHKDDGGILIMALVWTDDVHFAYSSAASDRFEKFLTDVYGKRWKFSRKGPVQKFVGLTIRRDRTQKTLSLSIPSYIEGVYKRFVPPGHTPRSSPYRSADAVRAITVAKDSVERTRMIDKPYLAAVASCIWIYMMLRADIAFVLNVLCSVMHDPSELAWATLLDLLSYLHATMEIGITYRANSDTWNLPPEMSAEARQRTIHQSGLHAWCDSSWRLPTVAGYVIMLMGAPVEWATKTVKVVCHSSAEAEVAAGCVCAKSLMYVRQICNAVGFEVHGPCMMLLDSEAGIAIGTNIGVTSRTAHFLRWQHYMRWCKCHCYVDFTFVSGKRQKADAITKPVDVTLLRDFRRDLYGQ